MTEVVERLMELVDTVHRRSYAGRIAADNGDIAGAMAHNTARLQATDKIREEVTALTEALGGCEVEARTRCAECGRLPE